MDGRRLYGIALSVAFLAVLGTGVLLATRPWFPPVGSDHGVGVQRMLLYTLGATGLFFVLGHLALAYIVGRFSLRPASRVEAGPSSSGRWERWLALGPAVVMALIAEGGVLALGLPVWGIYYGTPPEDALTVEVTGRQFFWVVRYPGPDGRFGRTEPALVRADNPIGLDVRDPAARDDVVLLNEWHVPVGRPVRALLRSLDVIHSLYLREFRVKQDAVPGMTISVWFTPRTTGTYEIACNHVCGLGHYRMRGFLYVDEPAAFEEWLRAQSPAGETMGP